MNDARDKFDKMTAATSAYALVYDGKAVARIYIKFGAAAVAYVQIWGEDMECGRATGHGYDKGSAAVEKAIKKLKKPEHSPGRETYEMLMAAVEVEESNWIPALELQGVIVAAVM